MPFTEAEAQHPEIFDQWRTDPANMVMAVPQPDGSTVDFYPIRELYQQAARFWPELLAQHQGQTILIVAHSAINRALISTAIGLGPERFNNLNQANCNISVLNFAGGWGSPVQVEAMNLTSHMGAPLPEMRRGHRGPRLLLVRSGTARVAFRARLTCPSTTMAAPRARRRRNFSSRLRSMRPIRVLWRAPRKRRKLFSSTMGG
jgi:probable phosphoglycerate mutase